MWIALGYLSSTESTGEVELRGKEYFNNLRMRSFFQDFVEYKDRVYCKMHDIVHDFAKLLRNTNSLNLDGREEASKDGSLVQAYNPSLVSVFKLEECCLEEIPREIGNLIHLRHLNLSGNSLLEELPETICNLQELQTLNLASCVCLSKLPERIDRLVNLKHLPNDYTQILYIPQGFQQFTELQTLRVFHAGRGSNKLGYLKRLDKLSGSLELRISVHNREDVNEAREAELRNKLPQLEQLSVWRMRRLEFLDREFLGVADGSTPLGFPKLKKRSFCYCPSWEKWEDITAEEEGSVTLSIMPCLRELNFEGCRLSELPHPLLHKA
ncbi:UNVERIFIED_CONTAM: putative disease resistance protein RGA1 [Sesamum angustifolium]|uniref:Disease resistance protein RGA1 n=1 Tax=Sesamum angustifolium TaxID=2727405 RepID=A0AAW2LJS8_9LAMI